VGASIEGELHVGQTHSGSLEGTPTGKIMWELEPRRKFIKQVPNITDAPALSQTLPILIS
jgi:hypothetical protein